MVTAITHIHTHRSWDSRLRPEALAATLSALRVDLAVVTDHDTFAGSVEFAAHCRRSAPGITVPVAAELRTDRGDVVVVFEPGTDPPPVSRLRRWSNLIEIVPDMGGLVWLPHPFRGHVEPEGMAAAADVIEVFNARCSPRKNQRARDLWRASNAAAAYSVDAHRMREIPRALVRYPDMGAVCETLRQDAVCDNPVPSPKSDKMAAEVINGIKRRRPALAAYFVLRYLEHRTREAVERR
jgi:predicted metal-dependent phosphoesterase TrpH